MKLPVRPPPRPVPASLRLRVLFGGVTQQMGWFFIGFGMIFVWVFGIRSDVSPVVFWGAEVFWGAGIVETEGRVLDSAPTNFSEGGSGNRKGTPVYRIDFTFEHEGRPQEARGYATGWSPDSDQRVEVEYPAGWPQWARIRGARNDVVELWGLFVLIFPVLGLGFVVPGLRQGLRAGRLLRDGRLAHGVIRSKRGTATRINNRQVYALTFEFTTEVGEVCTVEARTHEPEHLEDEKEEALLYDPRRPRDAVLLDGLPGRAEVGPSGELESAPRAALLALVMPALTLVGHGLYAWLRYG